VYNNTKRKRIVFAAALILSAFTAQAQPSETAAQIANLSLTDAIDIKLTGASTVIFPFTTTNDYLNGVVSQAQELKVRSTKTFSVAVKASAASFTYAGAVTPAPVMPVSVLSVKVSSNSTGGNIVSPFSAFSSITNGDQDIIANGTSGSNQLFSVMYQAMPSFNYPGGTYTVDVIYTATQH
jgi:hypothetical protein